MDARLGWWIDGAVGALSHVLHGVRGAQHDTVRDLAPYFDRTPDELFPAPRWVPDVSRRRALGPARGFVTESLSFASEHVPLCPRYRARHEREYAANATVHARWLHRPVGPRDRLLVYVHGWLEPGPFLEEATLLPMLARRLDVDAAHVQLPFHGKRNPRGALFHGEYFWSADMVRSLEAVRQSVLDVRTALGWFRARGYTEIGVTGMSLGGSITMLLACLESPPDWIAPIIAHLQLAEAVEEAPILWRMRADLERFGYDRAARAEIFRRLGLGALRPRLAPARQLWVAAEGDMFLTAPLVRRQWLDWGQPEVLWIPTGHMTFPLAIAAITERLASFHAGLARAG